MKFYMILALLNIPIQVSCQLCDLTKCNESTSKTTTLQMSDWLCKVKTKSITTCENLAELATEIKVQRRYPARSNPTVTLPSNLNDFEISILHLKDVVPILDDDQVWPETLTTMIIEDDSNISHLPNIRNSSIEVLKLKRIEMEFGDLSLTNFDKLTNLWIFKCNGLQNLTKLLSGLESLTELKVVDNFNLHYAGKLPPNWNKLTTLHLIENENLASLQPDFFRSAPNLAHIYIKDTPVSRDIFGELLKLENLKTLEIDDNKYKPTYIHIKDTQVKPNYFSQEQMKNINHLTLKNVSMTSEEFSTLLKWMSASNNIKFIDIRNNSISLTRDILGDLLKLESLKNLTIFDGNTYDNTDCHIFDQIKVLIDRQVLEQGDFNKEKEEERCKREEERKLLSAIIISIVVMLVFVILISISIYKFRYWFYSKQICSRFFSNEDDAEEKSFDAFLTFNEADRQIMKEIKDGLTNGNHQRKFKIATHDDDFVAGERIEENMRLCISQSRRTIAIISQDFLRSEYCQQELILMTSAENVHKIIVILLDTEILKDSTNALLDRYFKTHTYLDYDNGSDRFWKRLIYALPHRRMARVPKSHQLTELQSLA